MRQAWFRCWVLVVASISMLAATVARAELSEAHLLQLADLKRTLQLELNLDAAVRSSTPEAIEQLRSELFKAEAGLLVELMRMVAVAAASGKDEALVAMAMKMGPCHKAGMGIRIVTLGIANKSMKPKIKEFGVVTKPSDGDLTSTFADSVHACELIHRLPKSERKIGSTCAIDGRNCDEDDD